jgi:hypothetical protein
MNHHDIADPVAHYLSRLEEELALASANFLFSKLGLSLLVEGVVNHAVLILLKHNNADLLDKLLLGIDNVDIFDRFINEPLFTSFPLVAIEICEVLRCP